MSVEITVLGSAEIKFTQFEHYSITEPDESLSRQLFFELSALTELPNYVDHGFSDAVRDKFFEIDEKAALIAFMAYVGLAAVDKYVMFPGVTMLVVGLLFPVFAAVYFYNESLLNTPLIAAALSVIVNGSFLHWLSSNYIATGSYSWMAFYENGFLRVSLLMAIFSLTFFVVKLKNRI